MYTISCIVLENNNQKRLISKNIMLHLIDFINLCIKYVILKYFRLLLKCFNFNIFAKLVINY